MPNNVLMMLYKVSHVHPQIWQDVGPFPNWSPKLMKALLHDLDYDNPQIHTARYWSGLQDPYGRWFLCIQQTSHPDSAWYWHLSLAMNNGGVHIDEPYYDFLKCEKNDWKIERLACLSSSNMMIEKILCDTEPYYEKRDIPPSKISLGALHEMLNPIYSGILTGALYKMETRNAAFPYPFMITNIPPSKP